MRKKIISYYKFVEFFQTYLRSSNCRSLNNYESTLYLSSPRILFNLNQSGSLANHNKQISFLSASEDNTIGSVNETKSDKKKKLNNKLLDNLENKKNRQKKKTRTKIYFNEDFSNSPHDLDLSNYHEIALVRSRKSIRQKKYQKFNSKDFSVVLSSQENVADKVITFDQLTTIQDLSRKMKIPSAEIIKWLFLQGISVTLNQFIDVSVCKLVAEHYNFKLLEDKNCKVYSESSDKQEKYIESKTGDVREPIITIFGHVDHGKTTLLKALINDSSINSEAGNITQSIGAYEVELDKRYKVGKLIFLDTPGHEAFISMREIGARVTDLAILVVAADDGLKPQTIEAINHIKKHRIPFVVALNKIDKINTNIEKVKEQLAKYDVLSEDWGGLVPIVEVSAITGKNVSTLLEAILLLFDSKPCITFASKSVEGFILESSLDRKKGPKARVILQRGTLAIGDILVADNTYAKVKAIMNSKKNRVPFISSVSVAEVLGFSVVPKIGILFKSVPDEKLARSYVAKYQSVSILEQKLNSRIKLDAVHGGRKIAKQVNVILKADTQGSIEAIINVFAQIPQGKVQINVLFAGASEISDKDIELAYTSNSIILAFNLNANMCNRYINDNANLVIKQSNIIYDLVDYIKNYMLTFVDIVYTKEVLGKAKVKTVFEINKGSVAGCLVVDGKLKKDTFIVVRRKNEIVYEGKLNSLKRLKEDVEEVLMNYECGVMCHNYHLWHENDEIDAYQLKPEKKTL